MNLGDKFIFNTRFANDMEYNGKTAEIIGIYQTEFFNRYTIKFEDNHIIKDVYERELV